MKADEKIIEAELTTPLLTKDERRKANEENTVPRGKAYEPPPVSTGGSLYSDMSLPKPLFGPKTSR